MKKWIAASVRAGRRAIGYVRLGWQKAGFYVALACALTVLGGTAYYIRAQPPHIPENRTVAPDTPVAASPESVESIGEAQQAVYPCAPVDGMEILTENSKDAPIWSKTLLQWQPHTGVDYKAKSGEIVRAVLDGSVSRAYKDGLLGNVVEISHEGGLVTRYASLLNLDMAHVGDRVSRGQAIGAAGTSAVSESAIGAHVHFEAYRDGAFAELTFE